MTEKGKTNYSRNGPTQPKTLASTCKHNKSHTKEGGFTLTVAKQQQLNHTNANTVICCHCFSKQTMAAVQWLLYIHVLGSGRLKSYRKDPLKNTMLRGLARKVCKGAVVVSYLLNPKQILLPHTDTVHSHDLAFLAATLPGPLLEAIFIFRELPGAIFLVGEVGRLMRSGDTSRSKLFRGLLSSSPSFISTRPDSCSSHSSGWGGSDLVPLSTGCLLVSLPPSLPL